MTIITCKLGETAEILIPKEMLKDDAHDVIVGIDVLNLKHNRVKLGINAPKGIMCKDEKSE